MKEGSIYLNYYDYCDEIRVGIIFYYSGEVKDISLFGRDIVYYFFRESSEINFVVTNHITEYSADESPLIE